MIPNTVGKYPAVSTGFLTIPWSAQKIRAVIVRTRVDLPKRSVVLFQWQYSNMKITTVLLLSTPMVSLVSIKAKCECSLPNPQLLGKLDTLRNLLLMQILPPKILLLNFWPIVSNLPNFWPWVVINLKSEVSITNHSSYCDWSLSYRLPRFFSFSSGKGLLFLHMKTVMCLFSLPEGFPSSIYRTGSFPSPDIIHCAIFGGWQFWFCFSLIPRENQLPSKFMYPAPFHP